MRQLIHLSPIETEEIEDILRTSYPCITNIKLSPYYVIGENIWTDVFEIEGISNVELAAQIHPSTYEVVQVYTADEVTYTNAFDD